MRDIIKFSANMKHLAVLFFSLFATGCSAAKCVLNGTLDPVVVYDAFQAGAFNAPVPTIESGDNYGTNFSIHLNNAIRAYAITLLDNIVCQAIDAGTRLANCIKKASHEVIEATKSKDQEYGEEPNANAELQKLTSLLEALLDLEPGNTLIEVKLPHLPHQPVEYHSRTTKRSLKELFLYFDTLLNSLPSNVYGFMSAAFLEGWRNARLIYTDFSTNLRNEILNDKVLVAAKASVDKIYAHASVVQKCVLPETWKYFKEASYRIITISNDYCATQPDGDGCSSCTQCPYRLN